MESSSPTNNKKSFLENDKSIIVALLMLYGLCILGIFGVLYWAGNQIHKSISLKAVSTAVAVSTERANSTATTIVSTTEQAQYEYIDKFNKDTGSWLVESIDDEYMDGSITISGGIYSWNIREVKQPFYYWADSHKGTMIKNFDVYVDSRVVEGDACTGFLFRKSPGDWEDGTYTYSVCNNSYFEVRYYKQGEWDSLQSLKYTDAMHEDGWNRLEISVRQNHFVFRLNHIKVFEMTDDRLPSGGIALLVDVDTTNPTRVWFDNFGLQVP